MREFSWKYFALTGDVESYLLYKALEEHRNSNDAGALGVQEDQQELPLEEEH